MEHTIVENPTIIRYFDLSVGWFDKTVKGAIQDVKQETKYNLDLSYSVFSFFANSVFLLTVNLCIKTTNPDEIQFANPYKSE